jgi:hypothetical protein
MSAQLLNVSTTVNCQYSYSMSAQLWIVSTAVQCQHSCELSVDLCIVSTTSNVSTAGHCQYNFQCQHSRALSGQMFNVSTAVQCQHNCALLVQLFNVSTAVYCQYSCSMSAQLYTASTAVQYQHSCALSVQLFDVSTDGVLQCWQYVRLTKCIFSNKRGIKRHAIKATVSGGIAPRIPDLSNAWTRVVGFSWREQPTVLTREEASPVWTLWRTKSSTPARNRAEIPWSSSQ